MKISQHTIIFNIIILLSIHPLFGAENNPIDQMLNSFERNRSEIIQTLSSGIKQRRGGVDVVDNLIGGTIEWLVFDTATSKMVDRESCLHVINQRKVSLAEKTDFKPLLQTLSDEQLLFLSKAHKSWQQNKPHSISEKTEQINLQLMKTLPLTLQHERLFNVRYIPLIEKAQQIPLIGRLVALLDCRTNN